MKTSELAAAALEAWVAKALGEKPGTAYTMDWPAFDRELEGEAIQVAPMPGKGTGCASSWSEASTRPVRRSRQRRRPKADKSGWTHYREC